MLVDEGAQQADPIGQQKPWGAVGVTVTGCAFLAAAWAEAAPAVKNAIERAKSPARVILLSMGSPCGLVIGSKGRAALRVFETLQKQPGIQWGSQVKSVG
jgi:hypothetical protein